MKFNDERRLFVEQLADTIRNSASLERVIGRRMELRNRGRNLLGLCPFHRDQHLGSFVVTPSKGLWKCFTCGDGYGGDAVKFVSLYQGINYIEALFEVASEEGLITNAQYKKYYRGQKYSKDYAAQIEKKFSVKEEKITIEKAPDELISKVYTLMARLSPLSDKHKKQLKEERMLPEERIESDYFEFPYQEKGKIIIIEKLLEILNLSKDDLIKVPGFYYDIKAQKITFAGYRGIGILLRRGSLVKAIQIRKDTIKEGEQRYVWFSSSFAAYEPEKYQGGSTPGSIKDVLIPDGKAKRNICITEGRFKSEKIIADGNYAVSVQGVATWRGIDADIEFIRNIQDIKNIIVMFDADFMKNPMVFKNAWDMAEDISKKFPEVRLSFAVWDPELGKGIDDLIIAGHKDAIKYHDMDKMHHYFDIFEAKLNEYNVKSLKDIPAAQVNEFKTKLSEELKTEFL